MIRLRGSHRGQRAAVVFGGPSLLAQQLDFRRLRQAGFVTFLDTKALTPHVIKSGLAPDYYLLFFPDKAKDNALQHFIYRSFLANYRIDRLLKPEHRQTAADMRSRFDELFETWKPTRGMHKRYKYRQDVYLQDSPYALLRDVPDTKVIVNRALIPRHFSTYAYDAQSYYFGYADREQGFDAQKYFSPVERDGELLLRCVDGFTNSAAIALYPLLAYMGFSETYFFGMDMSLLGSMEYAAPFTFNSMAGFWWFMFRNGRAFSGNYKRNGWLLARPQTEFEALRSLWRQSPVRFTRVFEPWRYASRVDDIATCTIEEALAQ
jgi:hypothetical protein